MKQNSTLRFIQSDFVRYFIVLSDQILEPSAGTADDGYTRTCHQLKVEFPNSFIFFIEQQQLQEQSQSQHANSMFSVGDGDSIETTHQRSLNSEMNSLSISEETTDPLNAATLEFQQTVSGGTNSRFYNQLVNQRTEMAKQQQQQQQNSTASTIAVSTTANSTSVNTREMFNDWIGSTHHAEHVKEVSEAIAGTIDLMLRYVFS